MHLDQEANCNYIYESKIYFSEAGKEIYANKIFMLVNKDLTD